MIRRIFPFNGFIPAVIFILPMGGVASAQSTDSSRIEINRLIEEGNDFSEKQFDNQKALEKFQAAEAKDSNNYDILWRMSRSYVDIGEHLPARTDEEKEKQLAVYQQAFDYANKAISVNPNGAMGYTRRAIATGRIALFKGVWGAIDLVKQTRADCEKAIELDSMNNGAYYVLGRTHAKLVEKPRIVRWPLGLGWANMEEAIRNYERAIAIRPDFIMYRLDYARALVETEDYAKARDQLTIIATLPTKDEDDDQFRKEARALLDDIKDK